jgi:pantetheine-phosphate adenylyltransferase
MALANKHLAPDIDVVVFITSEEHTFISSTTVREVASLGGDVSSMVPPYVEELLTTQFGGKQNEHLKMDYMTSLRE